MSKAVVVNSKEYDKLISYIRLCKESCIDPFPTIFNGLDVGKEESIAYHNVQLNSKSWEIVNLYRQQYYLEGSLIRELCFVNVGLTDKLASHLSSLLKNCPYLEKLDISKNYLSSKCLPAIAASIHDKAQFQTIVFDDNYLSDTNMDTLLISLSKLRYLQCVSFARNSLTTEVVDHFCKYLLNFQSRLKVFDVSYNMVGDKMASAVAALFCNEPPHLVRVNISYCGVGDKGVRALASTMSRCSSLLELNLEGNFFGPDVMQQLAIAINETKAINRNTGNISLRVFFGGSIHSASGSDSFPTRCLKFVSASLSEVNFVSRVVLQKVPNKVVSSYGTVCFRATATAVPLDDILYLLACLDNSEISQWTLVQSQSSMLPQLPTENECDIFATFALGDPAFARQQQIQNSNHKQIVLHHKIDYESRPTNLFQRIVNLCSTSDATVRVLGARAAFFTSNVGLLPAHAKTLSLSIAQSGNLSNLEDEFILPIADMVAPQEDLSDEFTEEEKEQQAILEKEPEVVEKDAASVTESTGDVGDALDGQTLEEMFAAENRLREARQVNERLVLAVRRLYETKDIPSQVAKFWEGVFGNKKYARQAEEQLLSAMEVDFAADTEFGPTLKQYSHLFPSIARRLLAYQLMFSRDVQALSSLFARTKEAQGGDALILGKRLVSEVYNIQDSFKKLQAIARTRKELPLVENFLLDCARLGYGGEELFAAVELRAKLVSLRKTQGFDPEMSNIKIRAILTNLLVSRDFEALAEKIQEIKEGTNETLHVCEEVRIAEMCLAEHKDALQQLREALACATHYLSASSSPSNQKNNVEGARSEETQDIESAERDSELAVIVAQLDAALARCAQHNFYFSEELERAVQLLDTLCRNPAVLLRPVLRALRANDMSLLEQGFEEIARMGLRHVALDSAVCSKINAIKSKIVQDDTLKGSMVKLCLALKNGFAVPTGEILQLLRGAAASSFDKDPSMRPYYKILMQHSKKFAGLQRQERAIQELIAQNDVVKLSKLLSGRGTGRLVMCFPTAFAMEQWLVKIRSAASGAFKQNPDDSTNGSPSAASGGEGVGEQKKKATGAGDSKEEAVIFKGIFEKAARNESGELRSWRRRFFVLGSVHLAYFTKPGGQKKGFIRVLNGGVRRMSPQETGGKPFCLELEEGRDLSLVSPDLIDEARRRVRLAKIQEVEQGLQRGIRFRSAPLLAKMLQFAKQLGVMLDFGLMSEARSVLRAVRESSIKRDLYMLSLRDFSPKSVTIAETLQLAEALHVDPQSPSLKRLRQLIRLTEFDQESYRAFRLLQMQLLHSHLSQSSSSASTSLMASIAGSQSVSTIGAVPLSPHAQQQQQNALGWFDARLTSSLTLLHRQLLAQPSPRKKKMLLALLLQVTGSILVHVHRQRALPQAFMIQLLRLSVALCASLRCECEVLDLARVATKLLLITSSTDSTSLLPAGDSQLLGNSTQEVRSLSTEAELGVFLKKLEWFPAPQHQFRITKFPLLRSSVQKKAGLFQQALRLAARAQQQQHQQLQVMAHSAQPIAKSLLKHEDTSSANSAGAAPGSNNTNNLIGPSCVEMFLILQVLMGDALLSALPRANRAKILTEQYGRHQQHQQRSLESVLLQLLLALQDRLATLTDELFFQLCKQLTDNPQRASEQRGWLLFALFGQVLTPSAAAMPFLLHFVQEASARWERAVATDMTTHHHRGAAGGGQQMLMQQHQSPSEHAQSVLKTDEDADSESESQQLHQQQSSLPSPTYQQPHHPQQTSAPASSGASARELRNLVRYVLYLLQRQASVGHEVATHESATRLQALLQLTEAQQYRFFDCLLLQQEQLLLDVVLLTGEVHCIASNFGQLHAPQEVMSCVLRSAVPMKAMLQANRIRVFGENDQNSLVQGGFLNEIEQVHDDPHALYPLSITSSAAVPPSAPADFKHPYSEDVLEVSEEEETRFGSWMSRGFRFARLNASVFDDEGNVDLSRLEVQMPVSRLIRWDADLQWALLCTQLQLPSLLCGSSQDGYFTKDPHDVTAVEDEEGEMYDEEDEEVQEYNDNQSPHRKRRRKRVLNRLMLALRYEEADAEDALLDEFTILGDEFGPKEQRQRAQLCQSWLSQSSAALASTSGSASRMISASSVSEAATQLCPEDFFRLDLIFAEDCRFVNSRLAPLTDDSFHYLLALQVALCWTEREWSQVLESELQLELEHHRLIVGPNHQSNHHANGTWRLLQRKQQILQQFGPPPPPPPPTGSPAVEHGSAAAISIAGKNLSSAAQSSFALETSHAAFKRLQQQLRRQVQRGGVAAPPSSQQPGHAGDEHDGEDDHDSVASLDSAAVLRHLQSERLHTHHDEDDDGGGDSDSDSDSYQSSVEEGDDEDPEHVEELQRWTQRVQWRPQPVQPMDELSEMHSSLLQHILQKLLFGKRGSSSEEDGDDSVRLDALWPCVAACHQLCLDTHLRIEHVRYRYLMKRAFHDYLISACALYGERLVSSVLVALELDSLDPARRLEHESLVHFASHFEATEVLLALGREGLRIMRVSDWALLFSCSFWDVVDVDWEYENGRVVLLELNVNGLKLLLQDDGAQESEEAERDLDPRGHQSRKNSLRDVLPMLCALSSAALSTGRFAHCAEDLLAQSMQHAQQQLNLLSNSNNNNNNNNNSNNNNYYNNSHNNAHAGTSTSTAATGSSGNVSWDERNLQRFTQRQQRCLAFCSALPPPPAVEAAVCVGLQCAEADAYFAAPHSRRDAAAQERDEEERLQRELAKLALEAQLEKSQQLLAEGREAVRRKRSVQQHPRHHSAASSASSSSDHHLGGEHPDEDADVDNEDDAQAEKDEATARPSGTTKRKHRSVFSRHHRSASGDLTIMRAKERVSAMACGVPPSDSSQRFAQVQIPAMPTRHASHGLLVGVSNEDDAVAALSGRNFENSSNSNIINNNNNNNSNNNATNHHNSSHNMTSQNSSNNLHHTTSSNNLSLLGRRSLSRQSSLQLQLQQQLLRLPASLPPRYRHTHGPSTAAHKPTTSAEMAPVKIHRHDPSGTSNSSSAPSIPAAAASEGLEDCDSGATLAAAAATQIPALLRHTGLKQLRRERIQAGAPQSFARPAAAAAHDEDAIRASASTTGVYGVGLQKLLDAQERKRRRAQQLQR